MKEAIIEGIRIDLAAGNKIIDVARKYGYKTRELKKEFSVYEWEQFKKARTTRHAGMQTARLQNVNVTRRLYPQDKREVVCHEEFVAIKAMPGMEPKYKTVGKGDKKHDVLVPWGKKVNYDEMIGEADLWFYQNKPSQIGTTLLPVENDMKLGLRSYASQNIPYLEFSPAKRIHDTTHAIYQRKGRLNSETHTYELVSNWVELLTPEEPLVDVARHDIMTLNAKIGFADGLKDRLLTQEDGCIVSSEFAERFTYRFVSNVYFLREENDLAGVVKIAAGETLSNISSKDIVNKTKIQYNGEISFKPSHQLADKIWLHRGVMEVIRPLEVGDKLRSLSGMKCIVAEVREGLDSDILVHASQVVKDKPEKTKGAFIMEMKATKGYVMVGMRLDEIGGRTVNVACGSSLSAYLYPILKIWANDVVKEIVKKNAMFSDYLRALHLTYDLDSGTIMVTTPDKETGEGYKDIPHYLWRLRGGKGKFHYVAEDEYLMQPADDYNLYREEVIGGKDGKVTMNHIRWDRLFVPEFADNGYMGDSDWNKPSWAKYEGLDFDGRLNPLFDKTYPSNEEKLRGLKRTCAMDTLLAKKGLFPKIKEGIILTAIPTTDVDKITLAASYEEKMGDEVLIWREPCVSVNNVYSMPVEYDEKLPITCIKIPLDVIKAANGDTDGDPWAIAGYVAPELRVTEHEMPAPQQPNMFSIEDLDTVVLIKRTKDQLVKEALTEIKRYKSSKADTKKFGGLRKRASFSTDNIETQKKILKYGYWAEVDLKVERREDKEYFKERKEAEEYYESVIHSPNAKPDKESISDMIERVPRMQKIDPYAIIGCKPSGFWFDLLGLAVTEEAQKEEEAIACAKAGETIKMWSGLVIKTKKAKGGKK